MGVYPVKDWYDALDGKSRTNYGASVGSIPIRENILNPDYTELFHGDMLLDALGDPKESYDDEVVDGNQLDQASSSSRD